MSNGETATPLNTVEITVSLQDNQGTPELKIFPENATTLFTNDGLSTPVQWSLVSPGYPNAFITVINFAGQDLLGPFTQITATSGSKKQWLGFGNTKEATSFEYTICVQPASGAAPVCVDPQIANEEFP